MDQKKPILIAEDSEQDLQMLLRAFQSAGVENPVYVVRDGHAAIQFLSGQKPYGNRVEFPFPAILLLDLHMPKKDGFDVLTFLRENQLSTRLLTVVLTGLSDTRLIDKAYYLGANSFLRKPTRPEELHNLATFFKDYWLIVNKSPQPGVPVPKHQ